MQPAQRVDGFGLDQHVLEFTAIGAGIHPQPATDTAGNAAEKFETAATGAQGRLGDVCIQHRRADPDLPG